MFFMPRIFAISIARYNTFPLCCTVSTLYPCKMSMDIYGRLSLYAFGTSTKIRYVKFEGALVTSIISMDTLCIHINDTEYTVRSYDYNDNKLYCAGDIGRILGISNIHTSTYNMLRTDRIKLNIPTNGGAQDVLFITKRVVQLWITRSRSIRAKELAHHFDIDVDKRHIVSIEIECLEHILTAFDGEDMILQFPVASYRIDLYFPKYKLAIECDEDRHRFQKTKDIERQTIIEELLGCTFIRFEPQSETFSMFEVINKIYRHINSSRAT